MDSPPSLRINTHGSWHCLGNLNTAHTDHTRKDTFEGFGWVANTHSDNSSLPHHDNFGSFENYEMDTFLMALAESNHSSSSSASPNTIYEHNSSGTPPLLDKSAASVASENSSPMPEVLMDMPGERRRAQNRTAQRAHRDRQKRYVAQLERRYFALQANYNQLEEKYKSVQKEYESLFSFMQSQQVPLDSPPLRNDTESNSAFPSSDLQLFNEFSMCEQELDCVLAFRVSETPSPECRFVGG